MVNHHPQWTSCLSSFASALPRSGNAATIPIAEDATFNDKFADCEWTRISRKRRIAFYVDLKNGKWIYGFEDPEKTGGDRYLTMDELKSYPDLKNAVICKISVFYKWVVAKLKPLDVDMEVLVKFVFFLANKPNLHVGCIFPEPFSSPEGSTLLNFLQDFSHFSDVDFDEYNAKYNRLLERQYSWRKATPIAVTSIESGREFLEAELAALRLQKCRISESLSPNLLDAIVARDPRGSGSIRR